MKQKLFGALLVVICSQANSEFRYQFSSGLGTQYAGIYGAQFGLQSKETKWYASIGFVGLSGGVMTTVDSADKHSVGLVTGGIGFRQFTGVTYNFFPEGFNNSGWNYGVSFGRYDEASFFGWDDEKKGNFLMIELGYAY